MLAPMSGKSQLLHCTLRGAPKAGSDQVETSICHASGNGPNCAVMTSLTRVAVATKASPCDTSESLSTASRNTGAACTIRPSESCEDSCPSSPWTFWTVYMPLPSSGENDSPLATKHHEFGTPHKSFATDRGGATMPVTRSPTLNSHSGGRSVGATYGPERNAPSGSHQIGW